MNTSIASVAAPWPHHADPPAATRAAEGGGSEADRAQQDAAGNQRSLGVRV